MIKNDKDEARQHMINKLIIATFLALLGSLLSTIFITSAHAADVVPPEIQMPGTQPQEVGNFESPDKCDNCHAGYNDLDPGAEPATGWRGGAMGNAGRDPVFWATLAVAEQDFDGSGDLCIRCHSAKGWYGGRSTPTDGSGLASSDDNGIDCDTCHAMTNPDNTEHLGVMNSPFIANCSDDPNVPNKNCDTVTEAFYGSGILSLWSNVNEKMGPYSDAAARHQFNQSQFHRSVDFCGSCHDVSNSAVGDLASNHGAQTGAPVAASSQDVAACNGAELANGACLGGDIEDKAAFRNPPYAYGIVERTYSEYKSSLLPTTRVGDFTSLPSDLQKPDGSLGVTYEAAMDAGTNGDYEDGTPRYFSCQSCHMRPVGDNGFPGCNKNGAPVRKDLPRHDHTGGNYWFASMSQYQDAQGTLLVGGGLSGTQKLAMDLGQERATKHLSEAGSLEVSDNSVKVTNLTGHKLITGYPEGRRMWLNIKWYDNNDTLLREDGEYGNLTVDLDRDGQVDDTVETILDLNGANTEIYEAHYAVTKDWAETIQILHGPDFELSYDRVTGDVACTVSEFLNDAKPECSGEHHDTFHFALNNMVSKDNRIPPYGMSYTKAKKRNALPVPETRYDRSGDVYEYWDTVALNPPTGAAYADITLLYQGTSWEYIQFLQRANNGQNAFLGEEGNTMMDAWLNADVVQSTGAAISGVMQVNGDYKMVPPVVMATATWGAPPSGNNAPVCAIDSPTGDINIDEGQTVSYTGTATDRDGTIASWSWNFNGGIPGSSSIEDPGSVTYNTAGVYTTTFTANDDGGLSCTPVTVQVTVNIVGGENNAPVANDDSYTTTNDTALKLNGNVLDNDTDAEGDTLSVADPRSDTLTNGNLILNPDGSFEFTPTGTTGADSFTYIATDGSDNSNLATVTITVNAPVACGYPDEASCTADPACEWGGKGKNKSCKEAPTPPPPSACDGLGQTACTDDPACRWSKKDAICLTR